MQLLRIRVPPIRITQMPVAMLLLGSSSAFSSVYIYIIIIYNYINEFIHIYYVLSTGRGFSCNKNRRNMQQIICKYARKKAIYAF